MTKEPYSLGDWYADMSAYSEASLDPSIRAKGMQRWLRDHFDGKYEDGAEAEYKKRRFARAMEWYEGNQEGFDRDDLSVLGQERRLLGRAMVDVLYRFFSQIPDESLRLEPPTEIVEEVIEECLELERGRQGSLPQSPKGSRE